MEAEFKKLSSTYKKIKFLLEQKSELSTDVGAAGVELFRSGRGFLV